MIQRAISVSKAFGKVVVTVHGDVDGPLLGRTLADLAEDPGNLHLIVNLRDADSLDQDSLNVLSRSARNVQRAGGDFVLAACPPTILDALRGGEFTVAGSSPFTVAGSGPVSPVSRRVDPGPVAGNGPERKVSRAGCSPLLPPSEEKSWWPHGSTRGALL
jgi:anti-anti-sigma regulatory factor